MASCTGALIERYVSAMSSSRASASFLNSSGPLTTSHAASNWQCILDGALTKRMQAGQAASAGVFSATLAQTGFTGARNIFGGRLDAALAAIGRLETLRDARELMAPFTG